MESKKRSISEVEDAAETRKRIRPKVDHLDDSGESHRLSYPSKHKSVEPVPFQQPSTLLTFSYTPERVLEYTDSALRYYVEPPPRANLRYGYERWIKRPEERGRLDGLLDAISQHRAKLDNAGVDGLSWLKDIGVVSWRGVITKILTAPYEDRDAWELNVMLVSGTMYFEEHLTEERLREKEDMTPHHRLQSYYGYSFESYCTSAVPGRSTETPSTTAQPRGWGGDVDTNVQWCAVVKTKLGNQRLVIGGEVDCVRDKFSGSTNSLIELKTSLNIRGPHDEVKFEKKLLKFYFQSFLLGVPEIIVGFRTPQGQVTTTQSFRTIEIPRLVRGKPNAWDPSICLAWGDRFLAFLKNTMISTADEKAVWRVRFCPEDGVVLSRLEARGVEEVQAQEDRVGFLPRRYFDELKAGWLRGASSAKHDSDSNTQEKPAPPPKPDIPSGWQI